MVLTSYSRLLFTPNNPPIFRFFSFGLIRTNKIDEVVRTNETESRGVRVAIIGCPNVGKSALTNALIRANVCANTTTALTELDCQLIIVDSPGLIGMNHAKKFIGAHSDAKILAHPENAIKRASHILVVQDVTAPGEFLHHRILNLLHRYAHIPTSLVLNKIDLLPRRSDLFHLTNVLTEGIVNGDKIERKSVSYGRLGGSSADVKKNVTNGIPIHQSSSVHEHDENWHALFNRLLAKPAHKCSWSDTRKLFMGQNGWPHFKSVFFVSCTTGEGINSLRKHLQILSGPMEWHYDKAAVSTKNPKLICLENARSKFLDALPAYIAYTIPLNICEWEYVKPDHLIDNSQPSVLKIILDVNCDKERPARLVSNVCETVEQQLTEQLRSLFKMEVALRIYVKIKGRLYTVDHQTQQSQKN